VSNGTKCAGIKLENRTAGIADCVLQTCKRSEYFSPCTDKDKYYFKEQCTTGTMDLGEKCYRFFTTLKARADARMHCANIGMKLAEPSYPEFKDIQAWIRVAKPEFYLLLLDFDDSSKNDKSVFTKNGTRVTYLSSEWSAGEPNSGEDCVAVYATGLLNDGFCTFAATFLCQADHIN
jgi:hypothetical protein